MGLLIWVSAAQLEWKGVKESGLEWISLCMCGKERKQVVWSLEVKHSRVLSYSLSQGTASSPRVIPENIHPTHWMGIQWLLFATTFFLNYTFFLTPVAVTCLWDSSAHAIISYAAQDVIDLIW